MLKPINEEKLARSLEKVKLLKRHFLQENVSNLIHPPTSLSRIVARKGTDFVALNTEAVACFFSEHKSTFVRDFTGRQLMLDKNLAELES